MMSATLGIQETAAEAMDRRQEAAGRSLRNMLEGQLTFSVSSDFYAALEQLMSDTRQDLGLVFAQAISLYKAAIDFKRQGKHVGVADEEDKLEIEFIGLGSPDSGL